ncbi:uncharacterized protein PgNI_03077 [Pyricularia grisea]|uniref:Nephrocystin 3-like N-terminal domain-containing protein n=1 Tax=Pyricularia grisea TaxID=148305 RepID=A0A6P8B8N9_PYRGI|nr:uncharacterized protein PgNI_03077 [Pyricularia grisea]TLD12214.1 hypothetical protein PgNI_03077 [Pyricularia grisea]
MAHNTPLLGLYPLFQDGGGEWSPNGLDIIAVPGLDGHPFATWTASASAENSMIGPLWLRDFLPGENLPDARVYSYGYDAKSWLTQSKGSDLKTFSNLMLQSIVWARDGRLANRPLLFVCHGIGGLVVKQALVTAHLDEKEYPGVYSSIRSVMFLGVPHRGAGSLNFHQIMADMLVLGGLRAASPPGPDLVKKLQAEPSGLEKLSTDFRNHIKSNVLLVSCYEEVNMNKNGSERCLVPRESAILSVPWEKIIPMISCNHVTMVKFYTRNDHNYKNVAFAIAEVAKPSESPPNPKPVPSKESDPATKKQPQQELKKEMKPGGKPEANSTAKREPPAVVPNVADVPKKTAESTIKKEVQAEPKRREETITGLRECLASLEQACQQASSQSKAKEVDTQSSLPFTMDRVSKNTQYRQWLNSSTDGLLVIQGEGGSGKTTLAKQIFKNITTSQPKTLVLRYSFKETSAVNLTGEQWRLSFWSSLAHQLMTHKPESLERLVRRHHRLRIALTPGFTPVWKPDELLEATSREALPSVLKERNVIIFVDGIDACEKSDELLDDLQKYLLQYPTPASNSGAKPTEITPRFCSKICVTSTRELAAKEKRQRQSIHMEENNVEDLETYVHRQLEQVCALDQKGLILQRAQRSFLRARLLCEQAHQNIQQKSLESAPQLGDLYQHSLGALSPEHRSRGLNMIKWATFASRPLTLPELFVAIEMDSKIDSDITNLSVLFSPQQGGATQLLARETDMEGIVKHLSRGLLNVTTEAATGRKIVRPIHSSLAQLVMPPKVVADKVEKDKVPPSPESFVHLSMVNTCLRFLNIAMRDIQWRSRGSQDPRATGTLAVRPELAFSGYAESFWFRHAQVVEAGAGTLKPSLKWFGFTSSDGDRFLEDFIELARSCALGPLVASSSNPQQEEKTKDSQEKQADRAFEGAGWLHLFALYGLRTPLPAVSKVKQARKVDSRDQTPLHYAALQNHRPVVKSLISYAQDRDHLGNTPLHLAAMQGNVDALKAILKYSTVKNLANTPNSAGHMPLHHAVHYEHRSAAKALLDEKVGAQVDARLPNGKTPLMLTAEVGSHALAAVLLDAKSGGADINAADESGHTALSIAILNGNYTVAKLLVLRKTCAVDKADRDGRTPLMHVVRCGNLAAAKLLLDKRTLEDKVADVNAADGKQLTALLFAVSSLGVKASDAWVGVDAAAKVSDKMVKLLLDSGAQVTCQDKEKRTTVAIALEAAKKATGSVVDKALVVAGLLFAAYEKSKGADLAKWDRDWAESKKEYQAIRHKQTPSAAPKPKDSGAKPSPAGVSKSTTKMDTAGTGKVAVTATAASAKLQSDKKLGAAVNGSAQTNGTPAKPQLANGTTVTAGTSPTPLAQHKGQTETRSAPTAAAKQVVSPESVPKQPLSKSPAGDKVAGPMKATPGATQAVNPAKPAVTKPETVAAASSAKGVDVTKPAPQPSQPASKNALPIQSNNSPKFATVQNQTGPAPPKQATPPGTASKPSPQPIPEAKGVAEAKPAPLSAKATNTPPSTTAKTPSFGSAPIVNGQTPAVSQPSSATVVSPKQAPGPAATSKPSMSTPAPPPAGISPALSKTSVAPGLSSKPTGPTPAKTSMPSTSAAPATTAPKADAQGPTPLATNGTASPKVASPKSPTGLQRKIGSTTRPPMPRARISSEGGPAAAQQATQVNPAQAPGGQQVPAPPSSQPAKQAAVVSPASPMPSKTPSSQAAAVEQPLQRQTAAQLPTTAAPQIPASGPIKRKPIQSAVAVNQAPASKPAASQESAAAPAQKPPTAAVNPAPAPKTATSQPSASALAQRQPQKQSKVAVSSSPAPNPVASQPPAAAPVRKQQESTPAVNPPPASDPATLQPSIGTPAQKQPQQQSGGIQKPAVQKQQSTQQQPPVPPKGGLLQKPPPPPKPASSTVNVLQKPKPAESLPMAPQVQKQTVPAPAVRPAAGPITGQPQKLQQQAQVKQPAKPTTTVPLKQQQQQPVAQGPKPPPAATVPKKQEQQQYKPYTPPQGGPTIKTSNNGQKPPAQLLQQQKQQQQPSTFQQTKPAQSAPKESHQRPPIPVDNKQSPHPEPARRSSSFFSKFSDIFSSGKEKEKNDKPSPPSSVQGKASVNRTPSFSQKVDSPKPSATRFAPRESTQTSEAPPFQVTAAQNYSSYSQVPTSQHHVATYAAPQFYKQQQQQQQQHPGQYGYIQEDQFASPYQSHFGDQRSQQFQPGFDQRTGVGQTGYNDWKHPQKAREVHPNNQAQPGRDSNSSSGVNPALVAGGAGLAVGAGAVLMYNVIQSQNNEPDQSERAISPDSRTYSSYMESQYPTEYSTNGSQYQTEFSTYRTENEYQPADDTNRSFVAADDVYLRSVQKHGEPHKISDIEPEKQSHVSSQVMGQRLAPAMDDDVHSIPSPVPSTPSTPDFDRRSIDLGLEHDIVREDNDSLKSPESPLGRFAPDVDSSQFVSQSIQLNEHDQSEDEELKVPDSPLSDRAPSIRSLSIPAVNLAEDPNDDEDERISLLSHTSSRPSSRGFSPPSPDFPASDDEDGPDDDALNGLSEHVDGLQDAKSMPSFRLHANKARDDDKDDDKLQTTSMLDNEIQENVSDKEGSERGDVHKYEDEVKAREYRPLFADDEPQNNTGIPDDDKDQDEHNDMSFQRHHDLDYAAGTDIDRVSHADEGSQNGSEFGDGIHESNMQGRDLSLQQDRMSDRDDDGYSQAADDDNRSDHYDARHIDEHAPVAGYAAAESSMSSHDQEHDIFQGTCREEHHHTGGPEEQSRHQYQQEDHPDLYDGNGYYSQQTGLAQPQGYHYQYQTQQYHGNHPQTKNIEEDGYNHQQYHAHPQLSTHQPGNYPDYEQQQPPHNGAYNQGLAGAGQEQDAKDYGHGAYDDDGYGAHQQYQNQAQGHPGYVSNDEEEDDDQCIDTTNDMEPTDLDNNDDEDEDEDFQDGEYDNDDQVDYGGQGYGASGDYYDSD